MKGLKLKTFGEMTINYMFWQNHPRVLYWGHLKQGGDFMFIKDITNLQTDIIDRRGQKIIVKGSLGRGKEFKKEGTIEEAYSNHFTLRYDEEEKFCKCLFRINRTGYR